MPWIRSSFASTTPLLPGQHFQPSSLTRTSLRSRPDRLFWRCGSFRRARCSLQTHRPRGPGPWSNQNFDWKNGRTHEKPCLLVSLREGLDGRHLLRLLTGQGSRRRRLLLLLAGGVMRLMLLKGSAVVHGLRRAVLLGMGRMKKTSFCLRGWMGCVVGGGRWVEPCLVCAGKREFLRRARAGKGDVGQQTHTRMDARERQTAGGRGL